MELGYALRPVLPVLFWHQARHLKNIRGVVEQNYQRENQEMKLKW